MVVGQHGVAMGHAVSPAEMERNQDLDPVLTLHQRGTDVNARDLLLNPKIALWEVAQVVS